MENGTEKVCRRCGTLNDGRSLMCMRCGGMLEVTEEEKYGMFKGRLISGKMLSFLFVILFTAYLFGAIFYAGPWIDNKLLLFGETFIFDFYNNIDLTYITLEAIYTVCIFLMNSIAVSLIFYIISNSKVLKKVQVNPTRIFIYAYMLISVVLITVYKHQIDYVIILEHLVSIIIIFPYIKRKLFEKSV